MKILIFVEGTILMHASGQGVSREERVKQSQAEGIQREESNLAYESGNEMTEVEKGSVYDFSGYIPIGDAVAKLSNWKKQGTEIFYLSSRRIKSELDIIRELLVKYGFPNSRNLFFREQGEDYKDVVERILPNVLIEDDCESIGGEEQMSYTLVKPEIKAQIVHIPVKEFGGIDHLSNNLHQIKNLK